MLPKTSWETASTSWLFCARVGGSFQGIPWDFCPPDPLLPMASTASADVQGCTRSKADQPQETEINEKNKK